MEYLTDDLIEKLLEVTLLSTLERIDLPTQYPWIAEYDWINRLGWGDWDEATSQLSSEQLKSLVKLLVVCEKQFNWSGGSVAAAIWLFRNYERREPVESRTLAEWVLQHRGRNPWVPFGNTSFARTMEEREEEVTRRAQQCQEHFTRMETQKRRGIARLQQRTADHIKRLEVQKLRNARHREWVERFSLLPGAERLQALAESWPFPIDAFPVSLVPVDDESLRALPSELRGALVVRLGRRRGVWAQLRMKLQKQTTWKANARDTVRKPATRGEETGA